MEEKYGTLIRDLRKYLELSLASFGQGIGYTAAHVQSLERNEYRVTEKAISTICCVYKVDPGYFKGEIQLEDAVERVTPRDKRIEIGGRLRLARRERKITQESLAAMVGMSEGQVSRLEAGECELKDNTAEKLAEALEVGVEWLLKGDEEKKDYPVDGRLTEWLWQNPEIREELWKRMG